MCVVKDVTGTHSVCTRILRSPKEVVYNNALWIERNAEDTPFSKTELNDMLEIGSSAIAEIVKKQKACIE